MLLFSKCLVGFFFFLNSIADGKESACNAGDWGSIPGSGRSTREGNDYPLQYSCIDIGAWQAMFKFHFYFS